MGISLATNQFDSHAISSEKQDVLWRRGIWILALLALFVRGKILYVLLYTVFLAYILSRAVARRAFEGLRCERSLSTDRMFVGESTEVTVTVKNVTRWPVLWATAHDETTHAVNVTGPRRAVVSLSSGKEQSWAYHIVGRQRGMHRIGPLRLTSGDLLGTLDLHGRAEVHSGVIVYPRVHAIEDLGLPSVLPFGEMPTKTRFFDDPAHTIGIREYMPGDPYKNIHWKASARTGQLHVKEYQPTIALNTMVFLNLNEKEYEVQLLDHYSELAIEVAASIAFHLVQNRQSVGLVTNGHVASAGDNQSSSVSEPIQTHSKSTFIPPRQGGQGLQQIMELLATIQCEPSQSFASLVTNAAARLYWGTTLVFVTPTDSPELIEHLLPLHQAGFNIMVVVVGFEPIHAEYLHRPLAKGISFYHVRSPSEVKALGT